MRIVATIYVFMALAGSACAGPLSAAEARAAMRLPPGLRIELVAAAPQIESPVAMAFDEDWKLWVVEMRDYPTGPPAGQPPLGRIKCLEDRDGDGTYETSTVFADHLDFANGLQPWRGGLIVTAAPYILYLKDTDGDGVADQREVWFEGFSAGNPQLRVSSPLFAADNWVYVCSGLRGGKIKRPGAPAATAIDIAGKDFRFDPRTLKCEAVSGPGQFGQAFDSWGRRFVCDNRHHLRHVVLEERFLRRNRVLIPPSVLEDISEMQGDDTVQAGAPVYPLSKNWTTSNLHAGRFTAACGLFIYAEERLPKEYRGGAFVCEPTGNLVHFESLHPHGATFVGKSLRAGTEFLASTDDWFRPVFVSSGPDGGLYIVDMDRPVVEHPEWMPPEQKGRPDLAVGRDRGRIWRVVPAGPAPSLWRRKLSAAVTEELLGVMAQPAAWWHTTGHRLLVERGDRSVIALLRLSLQTPMAVTIPRTAAVLRSLDSLAEDDVLQLLQDYRPRIREVGLVSVTELANVSPRLRASVSNLLADDDARVRFCAALAMGAVKDVDLDALARMLYRDGGDRWARSAIATSVDGNAGRLLARYLTMPSCSGRYDPVCVRDLALLVGARRDTEEITSLLRSLWQQSRADARVTALDGLASGWTRSGPPFLELLNRLPADLRQRVEAEFVSAKETAANHRLEIAVRGEAIRLLGHAPAPAVEAVLFQLLRNEPRPDLRLAAVRALAARSTPTACDHLIAAWPTALPAARQEIAQALLARRERMTLLLDAVAAEKIAARDLDAAAIRRLTEHGNPEIRNRSRALFAAAQPLARKEVLAQYRAALDRPGDVSKGREIFRNNCATCHRIDGLGTNVGPDISDLRTKSPTMLLNDILDPNAAIDANYVTYQVQTVSGRSFSGLLASDTSGGVTLRRGENQTDIVLRADIEEIRSTGQSLMPEGMEKTIGVERMPDLLAFLKDWRYQALPKGK